MKITGIHVDGYGTLAGLDLDGLSPTLSVVYDQTRPGNPPSSTSSGRSFSASRTGGAAENRREPLRGGRHGGTLALLDAQGRPWTLERHSDAHELLLTGPDGRLGGETELQALLGGANAGALPLDLRLRARRVDFVRDARRRRRARPRLHGRGAGSGTLGDPVMHELESRRAGIVRQRSGDGRANQLKRRLDDVDARLRRDSRGSRGLRLRPGRAPPALRRHRVRPRGARPGATPGRRARTLAGLLAVLEPDPRIRGAARRPRPSRRGGGATRRTRPLRSAGSTPYARPTPSGSAPSASSRPNSLGSNARSAGSTRLPRLAGRAAPAPPEATNRANVRAP